MLTLMNVYFYRVDSCSIESVVHTFYDAGIMINPLSLTEAKKRVFINVVFFGSRINVSLQFGSFSEVRLAEV